MSNRNFYESSNWGDGNAALCTNDSANGWTCSLCQFWNYSSRTSCYKCRDMPGRNNGNNQNIRITAKGPDTNWTCPSCQFRNYPSRTSCHKCGHKQETGQKNSQNPSTSGSEWCCPSCKFPNYSFRNSCHKCRYKQDGLARPNESAERKSNYSHRRDVDDKLPNEDSLTYSSEGLIDWDCLKEHEEEAEAERWAHLPPIEKKFYKEHEDVTAWSENDVQKFRKENFDINVSLVDPECGIQIPKPVQTFEQAFHNFPEILKEIYKQGFGKPTPIQCQSWPILLSGYDMIGIAQTGSGKTLAFILPALLHINNQTTPRWKRQGPTCLILAPTRELAQQINMEVSKYQYQDIRGTVVYGQGDKKQQIRQLLGADIVIATPGRLQEFADKEIVNLSGVSYLVLDEADRMLDMGFEPQIRKIILDIRPDRQSVLTSATWPEGVRDLASKILHNPVHVVVGSLDLTCVDTVIQCVTVCKEEEKKDKLLEFVEGLGDEDKAIVFVGKKSMVDYLSLEMIEMGKNIQSMHGGREQQDRERALHDLKCGAVKVLLATDVAARGIDVLDITHILNFDFPHNMEEYVHRIGRTGRAGRRGYACTLMTWKDLKHAGKLIEIMERSGQPVEKSLHHMKDRWEKKMEERAFRDNPRSYGNHWNSY